jgi:hypothetical protein
MWNNITWVNSNSRQNIGDVKIIVLFLHPKTKSAVNHSSCGTNLSTQFISRGFQHQANEQYTKSCGGFKNEAHASTTLYFIPNALDLEV